MSKKLDSLVSDVLFEAKRVVSQAQSLSGAGENLIDGMRRYIDRKRMHYDTESVIMGGMFPVGLLSGLVTVFSAAGNYLPGVYAGLSIFVSNIIFGGLYVYKNEKMCEACKLALKALPEATNV